MPVKKTQDQFAAEADAKHGKGRFDYSEFDYKGSQISGTIRCIEHDIKFVQAPGNHLKHPSCPKCPGSKGAKRTINTDDLIKRGTAMYDGRYTYNNIGEPKNTKSPIKVFCTVHNEEFETTFDSHIYHRIGCPKCGREKQAQSNYVKKEHSAEHNFATEYPHIALQWHNRNLTKPTEYAPYSHTKVWWLCEYNHEWEMPISNRTKAEQNCPVCSSNRVHEDNSFDNNPDALNWWSDRNELTPLEYTYGSGETVWFKCDCATPHEFPMRICNFHKGERCPYKAGKLVDINNAVVTKLPEIIAYWDFEKNNVDPLEVCYGSGKKYWLKCTKCAHGWESSPNSMRVVIICPKCTPSGYSKVAIRWLNELAQSQNIHIQHAENGGEFTIPGTNYRADGYCIATNTIYEFHGSVFHGDPRLFDPEDLSYFGVKYGDLYAKTMLKEKIIRELGYNLVVMWEYDYTH